MEKTKDEIIREIFTWFILIFLIVVIVFPLGLLLIKSFENNSGEFIGFSNFREYFSNKNLLISLKNTFTISASSSIISLLLAFIYAYGVQRSTIRYKNIFKYIALMPLFAPTMMHGISLVYLFGRKGVITTGFFEKIPQLAFDINLYGSTGIIIAEVLYIFPQIFLVLNIV